MTFCIITHVDHHKENNDYYAYAPYVREMNIWFKYVDNVIVVAPAEKKSKTPLDIRYEHDNIVFKKVPSFDSTTVVNAFKTLINLPYIMYSIYKAMKQSDHIHLRSAGNMSLLGSLVQILFPKKKKTAKYAGNWDPKAEETFSITFQKWILNNTFLTRNMQVMVYGEWEGSSKNVKPLFTATYTDEELKSAIEREQMLDVIDSRYTINKNRTTNFVFVGTLTSRKRPLYAIDLIKKMSENKYNVSLCFVGEGEERRNIEEYIKKNNLDEIVKLVGNKNKDEVAEIYRNSEFVLLPSKIEGWPKAVAEAMFWGCVPVSTPISCVPFMLDNGNRGVLLDLNLEKDTQQIMTIIDNKDLFQKKSEEGLKWSRQYTMEKFESEIVALLQ